MSLESKEELLLKMKSIWIPSIINDIKKNYKKCPNCKKYSLKSKFKTLHQSETRIETTYTDCGYGDDDKYGEVEYMIMYEECPLCNNKTKVKKEYSRIIWEKNRR